MTDYDQNNSATAEVLQIILNYSTGNAADITDAPGISENLVVVTIGMF